MTSTEYLQTAKIEELASQLRAEGYRVAIGLPGEDNGYDLVAERGAQKLAFEVKARSNLQSFAEEIGRLRKQAREQGYDFRLVVVNPPREADVKVAGLKEEIRDYLIQHVPHELAVLSTDTRVEDVADLDIDSIRVTLEGVRVKGDGVVEIELPYTGEKEA